MHLTVTTEDKQIYLETNDATWPNRRAHIIEDDNFWNSVDQDIWAIQYHTDGDKHIEYKLSSGKGNVPIIDSSILQKYITKFNETESLYQSQLSWDKNKIKIILTDGSQRPETLEEKIARIGPRP